MKQGSGISTKSAMKPTTVVHPVSPAAVSQMGSAMGNHATDHSQTLRGVSANLYPAKKGFLAPPEHSMTTHKSGSQGRS